MVYKWYILPIVGLYATYHLLGLLGEPETTIDMNFLQKGSSMLNSISFFNKGIASAGDIAAASRSPQSNLAASAVGGEHHFENHSIPWVVPPSQ